MTDYTDSEEGQYRMQEEQNEWQQMASDLSDAKAEIDRLRALLLRARKFVEDDTLMIAAITRHAPLPPDAQAIHDSTEYLSEILLREIDSVLLNSVSGSTHLTPTQPPPHNHQAACPNDTHLDHPDIPTPPAE